MTNEDFQVYKQIKKIYPDRIPIVFENHGRLKMDKTKYLVPNNITIGELLMVVRKQIHLSKYQALFLFVDKGTCLMGSDTIEMVYEKHKDSSGLLYIRYDVENTFG